MLKKLAATWMLVGAIVIPTIGAFAANVTTSTPTRGTTTIYPNKLTVKWENGSKTAVTIDSFRAFGYNVAQLRTMVSALGGTVVSLTDKTYQIKSGGTAVAYTDIGFDKTQEVSYILNTTQIRDNAGALITPGQPGWVYLPAVQYNWASIRD
ncbi:MAG: hypothetical protein LBB94_01950, partial [Clostridiales bacterium]|nr:hypothetical protein [Clostridiales bacterium]